MVNWAQKRQKAGDNIVRQAYKSYNAPTVGNIANLAWKGVKGIRALINAEKHFTDTTYATVLSTNAAGGTLINLNAIAQNDLNSGRTGNSVLVNSVYGRMKFTTHASSPNQVIRYMLIHDKQQVPDTAIVAGDVLENLTYSDVSPLNRNSLGRYKILFDRRVQLSANKPQAIVKWFKHFKRHHIRFNGTGTPDYQRDGLFLLILTEETTNMPSLQAFSTTAFYDN